LRDVLVHGGWLVAAAPALETVAVTKAVLVKGIIQ